MPGAFAHITAIHFASETSSLEQLDMPKSAKFILVSLQRFVTLGCVSPDYPYLVLSNMEQHVWADKMHYEKVGDFIREAISEVKQLNGEEQKKAFAWLCGYLAHVITDITIHPVIELRVGPYAQNAKQHRICEMHQDAYIWPSLGLGEVGYADVIAQSIGACTDSNNSRALDPTINTLWSKCLNTLFGDLSQECAPDINSWHRGFQLVVNSADEGHRLFPMARHVAAYQGWTYPSIVDIDDSYISNLKTPCRDTEHYEAVFHRAVFNIQQYWCYLAQAIFSDGDTDNFLNWNLDTGLCENGNLTAWGQS
jgi:hypothetical protein